MESSPHVMLAGVGADNFAQRLGLPMVSQDYFWTKIRWDQLVEAKGTVGAVAVDPAGRLAAATSTAG